MSFSVALPFRDTPSEREFAKRSIPALVELNPSEIVIGADAPANPEFEEFVRGLCGSVPCVMVWTEQSAEWGFHLAHITWDMYETCKYDTILTTCVDIVLWPDAVIGVEIAKDHGEVSCAYKIQTDTLVGKIRWFNKKRTRHRNPHVNTGVYWLDRSRLSTISPTRLREIRNGIDNCILDCLEDAGHDVHTIPGISGEALDIGNPDYPWRQFGLGIWIYANRKTLSLDRRWRGRIARRFPILYALKVCMSNAWPWVVRGYIFAKKNPDHAAVNASRGKTYTQSTYQGTEHIRNIRDWGRHGRLGTGYE